MIAMIQKMRQRIEELDKRRQALGVTDREWDQLWEEATKHPMSNVGYIEKALVRIVIKR